MANTTIQHPQIVQCVQTLHRIEQHLIGQFVGKDETIRLMLTCAVAREHLLLVGPPGTAKSALVRALSNSLNARYFEYLLTRFTEPNELFGPIDIQAFREGAYKRRVEGMLPEAEFVFLDEIFKASSAILNTLLSVLNERKLSIGSQRVDVPLRAVFAASNEIPEDSELDAVYDRFLLRVESASLPSYQFLTLLDYGIKQETKKNDGPKADLAVLDALHGQITHVLRATSTSFLSAYKSVVMDLRAEGIGFSDRRAVKFMKLFAASAILDGRSEPDLSDLGILRHAWNTREQQAILVATLKPILEAASVHRTSNANNGPGVHKELLLEELNRVRDALLSGRTLSEPQLFANLRSLEEMKRAFLAAGETSKSKPVVEIERLLTHVLGNERVGLG